MRKLKSDENFLVLFPYMHLHPDIHYPYIHILTNTPPKKKTLLLEEVQRMSSATADSDYRILNVCAD